MIDWNDNGHIDPEELAITAMLLDDEIQEEQDEAGNDVQFSEGSGSPNIGCLIVMAVLFVFFLKWMTGVIH